MGCIESHTELEGYKSRNAYLEKEINELKPTNAQLTHNLDLAKKELLGYVEFKKQYDELFPAIDFEKIDLTDLPRFTFNGIRCPCRFASVYDGDTADIVIQFRGVLYRKSFRFAGYDAYEMKPKAKEIEDSGLTKEEYKRRAVLAKNRLIELVMGKVCTVQFTKEDPKWGRPMGYIFIQEQGELKNVTDIMLVEKHGKIYNGGIRNMSGMD